MEPAKYKLFKQSITVGGEWNETTAYDRLTIVTYEEDNVCTAYISRTNIQPNTKLDAIDKETNQRYWIKLGGFAREVVSKFKNKIDDIESIIGAHGIIPEEENTIYGHIKTINKSLENINKTSFIVYKGKITTADFNPNNLADKEEGLYIFVNADETTVSNRQAEDFDHYNQRGIEVGELVDKGSYTIPANCRDLFYWHNLRKDFDWTIETGDVLLKVDGKWNIIASEDTKESGSKEGSYPEINIEQDTEVPSKIILAEDKEFLKGTEEVYVNGVRYFIDNGYSYLSDEEDVLSKGILFDDKLKIDTTDFIKMYGKI